MCFTRWHPVMCRFDESCVKCYYCCRDGLLKSYWWDEVLPRMIKELVFVWSTILKWIEYLLVVGTAVIVSSGRWAAICLMSVVNKEWTSRRCLTNAVCRLNTAGQVSQENLTGSSVFFFEWNFFWCLRRLVRCLKERWHILQEYGSGRK